MCEEESEKMEKDKRREQERQMKGWCEGGRESAVQGSETINRPTSSSSSRGFISQSHTEITTDMSARTLQRKMSSASQYPSGTCNSRIVINACAKNAPLLFPLLLLRLSLLLGRFNSIYVHLSFFFSYSVPEPVILKRVRVYRQSIALVFGLEGLLRLPRIRVEGHKRVALSCVTKP